MLNAVVNKPNRILEKQKAIQNDHRQLWYRLPRSKIYLTTYYTGFTFAMVGVTYGIFSLVKGKPAGQ